MTNQYIALTYRYIDCQFRQVCRSFGSEYNMTRSCGRC